MDKKEVEFLKVLNNISVTLGEQITFTNDDNFSLAINKESIVGYSINGTTVSLFVGCNEIQIASMNIGLESADESITLIEYLRDAKVPKYS